MDRDQQQQAMGDLVDAALVGIALQILDLRPARAHRADAFIYLLDSMTKDRIGAQEFPSHGVPLSTLAGEDHFQPGIPRIAREDRCMESSVDCRAASESVRQVTVHANRDCRCQV